MEVGDKNVEADTTTCTSGQCSPMEAAACLLQSHKNILVKCAMCAATSSHMQQMCMGKVLPDSSPFHATSDQRTGVVNMHEECDASCIWAKLSEMPD